MTASDHLSGQQFYHSTHSELSPGDMIMPGHRRNDNRHHFSDDFPEHGHHNFTWMSTEKPGRYASGASTVGAYGKNTYEVEPQGLHHPYSYNVAMGEGRMSSDNANSTWVSLGGAKVIRKVPDDEPRIGDAR